MRKFLLYPLAYLGLLACQQQPLAKFEIQVDLVERFEVPIHIDVAGIVDGTQAVFLMDPVSGSKYPAELNGEGSLATVLPHLPKGTQVFHLFAGTIPSDRSVSVEETDSGIQVNNGENKVFFYQTAMAFPKEGLPDYYKRNGMIHPLTSPGGQVLTDDFPAGHVHQHAIFNAWVNTMFRGEKVDFWNQHQGTGTVEHKEVLSISPGKWRTSFAVKQSHISLKHGEVLEETWELTTYPTEGFFVFDLCSEQINTSQDTLHLLEYHYGGMGFRGSREWNVVDSIHYTNEWKILTSEGHTKESANHTKAKWISAYGEIGGETAGVTVFGHPDNFRYPQIVRVHPTMPYWVYSPMYEGGFHIAPGARFKARYRFYVHQGIPDEKILASIEADLTRPISIKVLP
ncbi:hypothetical protein ADIS_1294 [Lunatimonas lonarensis]|uniref:Methane oxygenase PmoA n=1 Tax=Lunatimonas lonarensis TaxID=1232681 RepID=R7ZVK3_9BACT|nr:PmoA family protein [Lunatimonas lonarensis]EON78097.1 hypothetical protein ADIS_1294 [Lunatimonas lonarensis]